MNPPQMTYEELMRFNDLHKLLKDLCNRLCDYYKDSGRHYEANIQLCFPGLYEDNVEIYINSYHVCPGRHHNITARTWTAALNELQDWLTAQEKRVNHETSPTNL